MEIMESSEVLKSVNTVFGIKNTYIDVCDIKDSW